MPGSKKASECGWFYHAPARTASQSDEPAPAPAPSQIPGLSDLPYEEEQPRLTNLRDTDTKYIRLAKQGGRPDLLQMKQFPSPPKEAQGYPRCEWFYLQDNAASDAAEKPEEKPYEFKLPEYMVHRPRQQPVDFEAHDGSDPNSRYNKRAPYAFDKLTTYEREGESAADKMSMKIPEAKKYGYGVRQGKKVVLKKTGPAPERVKPVTTSQVSSMDTKPKYQAMPEPKDLGQSGTVMSTLLSYGYEREWHDRLKRWQSKQEQARETLAIMRSPDGPPTGALNKRIDSGKSRDEEELFKLSRFKNVPPRVDDRQKPELLKSAAVH
ncbi:uncharacterized protein C7orf57 homolog [Liolophura sinensis]|uniref:uncharacterized protein C7orf57 homolog n=1 Tax=Liolophura sinensis TaxID=3198878 RepID=UPI0031593B64